MPLIQINKEIAYTNCLFNHKTFQSIMLINNAFLYLKI